jgi:hypothetical protein
MMGGYPYSGYNMGYGYYPGTVVIINDNNRNNNIVYGRHATRSSDINNTVTYNNRSSAMVTDSQGRVRGSSSNGRVSGDGASTSYYQRGWRTNPETNSAVRSNWSSSGRTGGNDDSGLRSNYNNGRSNNSSFFDGGSRSSNWGGSNFSSGGSRSSGMGGGGSSGVRRGRD